MMCCLLWLLLLLVFRSAAASHAYKLGMLVKTFNNEFFQLSRAGCNDRARLTNNSTCLYRGPLPTDEIPNPDPNGTLQADMLYELLELDDRIDGLAVSVKNPDVMTPAINRAMAMGIPVVTFDSDAALSQRISYIGTDNTFMGVTLAKTAQQIAPNGGTFAILMSDDATNMIQRQQGFRQEMLKQNTKYRTIWRELPESPFDFRRNLTTALQQMQVFAQQNVTVLTCTTGGPMWHENYEPFVNRNLFRNITIVLADDFPKQLDFLSRSKAQGLVGQLPYEQGVLAAQTLLEILQHTNQTTTTMPPPETIGTNLISHIQVPLVLPELVVDNNLIGSALRVVGYILFSTVTITVLMCMAWTVYRRKLSVVQAAQPGFLFMLAVGVLIMGSALVPLTMDDNGGGSTISLVNTTQEATFICMSVPWLGCCGFTITFSALFSKMRRFNRVLKASRGFQRVKVSTKDVLAPFVVLLTLNVIVLSLWSAMDPLTYVRKPNPGTDGWNRILSTYGACRSENVAWYLIPLGIINLGVLCYANYQAYVSRKVKGEFSESKYIMISMISLLQALLTGFPVVYVVRDSPQAFYLVTSFMVFVVCMAILLLIFIPKMLLAHKFSKKSEKSQRQLISSAIRRSSVVGSSSGSIDVRKSRFQQSSGDLNYRSSGRNLAAYGDNTGTSATGHEHENKQVHFDDIEEPTASAPGDYKTTDDLMEER